MCGIVGVVSQAPVNQLIYDALLLLQHRGQDAAGIVTEQGRKFFMHKAKGMVRDVFRTRNMRALPGNSGLGQVRYPTAGNAFSEEEAQPFYVNAPFGLVLVHNGNLTNAQALKQELFQTDHRHINTDSDSEVLLNVLAHELEKVTRGITLKPADVFAAVRGVHQRVRGSYAVVALIAGHGLLAFRDPYGIRPLCVGRSPAGVMVASESVALEGNGFTLDRDIQPGEALFVPPNRWTRPVWLKGSLSLSGVCDTPRVEAQLRLTARDVAVQPPQRQQIDAHGSGNEANRQGGRDRMCGLGNCGACSGGGLELIGYHFDEGTQRGQRAEDNEVSVAPIEGPFAVVVQGIGVWHQEVHPPQGQYQAGRAQAHQRHLERPAMCPDDAGHGICGAEHALAQHDDREQPVALGDVMGMPGRMAGLGGPHRNGQFQQHQHEEARQRPRGWQGQAGQPQQLQDPDTEGIAHRGAAPLRVLARGAQPHRHQADAHHRVADRQGREVALRDLGHACGQDQHADHLHHRPQPVGGVVRVVGAGEPGEVHPGPPDGGEAGEVGEHPGPQMVLADGMVKLRSGRRDGDDKGQVKQQLERRGHTMRLVNVAAGHAAQQA